MKEKGLLMKKLLIIFLLFPALLLSAQLSDYIDVKKCDQVIDKQLYSICYSYKQKSALGGWVKLDNQSQSEGIKQRPR